MIAFLSELLGVNKSHISIVRGHNRRNKLIAVDGLSQADVMRLLFPR